MSTEALQVLNQLLKLPESDRAHAIHDALASLDGERDPNYDALWAAEIQRRAKLPESEYEDWEVVRAELDAEFPA